MRSCWRYVLIGLVAAIVIVAGISGDTRATLLFALAVLALPSLLLLVTAIRAKENWRRRFAAIVLFLLLECGGLYALLSDDASSIAALLGVVVTIWIAPLLVLPLLFASEPRE